MASQELEPCLRMAIGHVRMAAGYIGRITGNPASIDAAIHDMERAIAHIEKFAEKKKIHIRESMKT